MALKYFCIGYSRKHASSSKRPYQTTLIEESFHHFSLADLKKATNNFHENNLIGRGGFGKVYKGCLQLDHVATAVVAVKVKSIHIYYKPKEFKNEIELLCQLRHPNLISLIGFCVHKDKEIIVYEYMSNGSLADRLFESDAREPLSWKKRLEICIGVARGLHYLHSGLKRTIIHRDIKPANILLDDNMVPKLSDLGISVQGALFTEKPKPIQVKEVFHSTQSGTYNYMAPEYIRKGTVTDQYDVYSFGIVLIDVVSRKPVDAIRNEMFGFQQPTNEKREMSNNGSESSSDDHITMIEVPAPEPPNEEVEMSNNGSESSSDDHITMIEMPVPEPPNEEVEMSNNDSEFSDDHITMSWGSKINMLRLRAEYIDPALVGNIAPQCYAAYIDIIDRCLKDEPNERPNMGEVELLLEHALTLQLEADATDTSDH
ncbi:receptor-like protein kinase ANXUR1 isoform X1 [Lotus japonicus]|uniref:receptor-like protein kinase ANXUR1 isoform X1 n=1 Tax=Lotus japonicus TaxID=34305 RepID=UPI00258BC406|nr:receptor-like protein kinase ANXUR1 isoform X1 [Lotus japonicus]XP_057436146.1 receptor-like protein kinase ANXUR1 isoform X1 [Lotus japonicus]